LPELPAYASTLKVSIIKNNFFSDFYAEYPMFGLDEKLTWTITKQTLILNSQDYKIGDIIKGYVEVEFIETSTMPKEKPVSKSYYFKGFFKTPLTKNN
jgi:hypothetical protein